MRAELSTSEAVDGSVVLVNVQLPKPLEGGAPVARYGGLDVPLFPFPKAGPGAYQAVIGVPHNKAPGQETIHVTVGAGADARTLNLPFTVVSANYKTERLRVAGKHVNPRSKDMKRIVREIAEVGEVYKRMTLTKFWDGPFKLPVRSVITSPYGTKRFYNGEMRNFHQGLDLRAKVGTPIHSAAPGIVAMAKDLFFTGNTVIVDHGYGVFTLYAHMSRLDVKAGDEIASEQRLGLAGATGRAAGPHLHWGAIVQKAKVNPLQLTEVLR